MERHVIAMSISRPGSSLASNKGVRDNTSAMRCVFPPGTTIICMSSTKHPSLKVITDAIDSDYKQLFPDVENRTKVSNYLNQLNSQTNNLSTDSQLILLNSKQLIVPIPAIKMDLCLIHTHHYGLEITIFLAKGLYFWPLMQNNITQLATVLMFSPAIRRNQLRL